jgi:hypothetical protein
MQKFMPRSCVGVCRNKSTRSTPLDQKLMFFLCFVVFGCILDHSFTAWNSMQNGLNWCNYCKSSCHEVISELFAKNAPDRPQWTLNSCFVAFRSVWAHLGPFRYCMKLGAKWPKLVQLMQKFGPRSRVEFFAVSLPDWTHGTLNSCFGAFHSVPVYLGLFYYGSKTRCKMAELVHLVQKFVRRSRVGIFRNERTQTSPYDPKLIFWRVS